MIKMNFEFLCLVLITMSFASTAAVWVFHLTNKKPASKTDLIFRELAAIYNELSLLNIRIEKLEEKQTVFEEEMEIKHTNFCSNRITRDNEIIRITNGHTQTLNRQGDLIRELQNADLSKERG